jgi:signal transduction histidine kinase
MERPPPELYQPRLTWWSHTWRYAVCLVLTVMVAFEPVQDEWKADRAYLWLDLTVGAVSFVLVFWRRRFPLGVAVVLTVFGAFSATASGPGVLAAVSLASRRVWWQIVLVGGLNLVAGQVYRVLVPGQSSTDSWWLDLIVITAFTAGALAWGMYIGSRRELVWTLKNRAERAEAEQELRVGQARGNERARIAREMHDVLAHRISQISMHAGALGFRSDLDADQLREHSNVIRDLANAALDDLRGVLGVLRDPETGALASAPQPTWADLPALVDQAREAGFHVEFVDRLDGDQALPDVVGRTLYRIVQEGITNAAKHAPGAVLRIEVSGTPQDGVDITLSNPIGWGPTATPGSGLGLIGLTERAELRGGRLEGRRDGQRFVLHGWIPWAA